MLLFVLQIWKTSTPYLVVFVWEPASFVPYRRLNTTCNCIIIKFNHEITLKSKLKLNLQHLEHLLTGIPDHCSKVMWVEKQQQTKNFNCFDFTRKKVRPWNHEKNTGSIVFAWTGMSFNHPFLLQFSTMTKKNTNDSHTNASHSIVISYACNC